MIIQKTGVMRINLVIFASSSLETISFILSSNNVLSNKKWNKGVVLKPKVKTFKRKGVLHGYKSHFINSTGCIKLKAEKHENKNSEIHQCLMEQFHRRHHQNLKQSRN